VHSGADNELLEFASSELLFAAEEYKEVATIGGESRIEKSSNSSAYLVRKVPNRCQL